MTSRFTTRLHLVCTAGAQGAANAALATATGREPDRLTFTVPRPEPPLTGKAPTPTHYIASGVWTPEQAAALLEALAPLIASGDVTVGDAKDGTTPDGTLAACGYEVPG